MGTISTRVNAVNIGSTCVAHTSPHSAAAVMSLRQSLRSAQWLASSLKLAARCPVSGCWPSYYRCNQLKVIPLDSRLRIGN